MSRETFVVRATLQSKVAAKGEVAPAGGEILLHIPHIVCIVDTDKGSEVLTSTGVVYAVTQKQEYFLRKGKAYNVFKELEQ
jgi:hypothetical protein